MHQPVTKVTPSASSSTRTKKYRTWYIKMQSFGAAFFVPVTRLP